MSTELAKKSTVTLYCATNVVNEYIIEFDGATMSELSANDFKHAITIDIVKDYISFHHICNSAGSDKLCTDDLAGRAAWMNKNMPDGKKTATYGSYCPLTTYVHSMSESPPKNEGAQWLT